ncbi:MAG: hypothetical protein PF961_00225 [Planctomycetota bacterium]|jgi:hypothetical protein|nr:hypothetical protein [Planctomycetota bacterium]
MLWRALPSIPLIIVAEIASGLAWCTAECAIAILLFGCHHNPNTRARLIALHQSISSLIVMACSMLGAAILVLMPAWTGSTYRDLFQLSGLLRIPGVILALMMLPSLKLLTKPGRTRLRQALAQVPPPTILGRGLLRFMRRPEG